jgi:NDP-sugar pyrophosphorylase family protein
MDVRAILLIGNPDPNDTATASAERESFSGVPYSLLPVLGKPLLHRFADRLKKAGVDSIAVLNTGECSSSLVEDARRSDLQWKDVLPDQAWREAEGQFDEFVHSGADLVLLVRLGAYAEVEIDPLIQFHLDQRNHVTQVAREDGALDFFVLSSSRRNDAAFLMRNKFAKTRVAAKPFMTRGYVNPLQNAADFRRLVLDSFSLRTSIQPLGEQVRPGIWIGTAARVHRSARLVAPCYIGPYSKVRKGALITRGSSVEHHSVIDCGSVIEASTLLPLSYLGAGLDLTHSILGNKRIVSVKYGAELEVEDNSLVSAVPATSALRTLKDAANLAAFVPRQFIRSLVAGAKAKPAPAKVECPSGFDAATVSRPSVQEHAALTSSVIARVRE